MIKCLKNLSTGQLFEIESLLQKCKIHDGNSIPIYKHLIEKPHPIACNILYYEDKQLVGYLRSFFFFESACEITLMVDPDYRRKKIATQLLLEIIPIMQREAINKLIFSAPPETHKSWFENLGLIYRNSEYHMRYDLKSKSTIKPKPVMVRFATSDDIPILCTIDNSAFPNKKIDPESIFNNLLRSGKCEILVLSHNDEPIGKAHVFSETDKVRLTDIGILPEYRSQGFGSSLIKNCINHCLLRNKTNIVLDVETNNKGALKLYKNLGFNIVNSHEYWYTPEGKENFGLDAITAKYKTEN